MPPVSLDRVRAQLQALPPGTMFTRDGVLELLERAEGPRPADGDEYRLTAEEAARMLSVTVDWLYRRTAVLPFARKLSRKVVRYSEAGIRRYLAEKSA